MICSLRFPTHLHLVVTPCYLTPKVKVDSGVTRTAISSATLEEKVPAETSFFNLHSTNTDGVLLCQFCHLIGYSQRPSEPVLYFLLRGEIKKLAQDYQEGKGVSWVPGSKSSVVSTAPSDLLHCTTVVQ